MTGAGAVLVLVLLVVAAVQAAGRLTDAPLRDLGERRGLVVGAAVGADELRSEAPYRRVLARDYASVTPENAMKWASTEPDRGVEDFRDADALVGFATAHGQQVRGHTLVWYRQLPGWLVADGDPPADELRALLRRHITDTVGRYRGRVASWDVVNEAVDDDGSLRGDVFARVLGPGYVADAFRWAYEADPGARLYYNDYGLEDGGPKADAVHALVSRLVEQGVPIDGVGFQGHVTLTTPLGSLTATMDRFAALGLATPLTEVDVRIDDATGARALQEQAGVYGRLVDACLEARDCPSFTTWGVDDAHSWVPGEFPGQGRALLRDARLDPKPAYERVRAELLGRKLGWLRSIDPMADRHRPRPSRTPSTATGWSPLWAWARTGPCSSPAT